MGLNFATTYNGTEIRAEAKRPITTQLSLYVGDKLVAQASRPISTDLLCGIRTWFGQKPKWEIKGRATIKDVDHDVAAIHYTTFTKQFIHIYVDGKLIGPETGS